MLNDIRSVSKHSAVYALGNIATKVIGIILIPLYTNPKFLSEADYGALAVLEASSQLLVGVLAMAMTQGLIRWYWEKKYLDVQSSIFFTTLVFLVSVIVPVTSLLLLFSEGFSQLIFNTDTFAYLIRLTILASGFRIINNQILTLARLQSKSVLYSAVQVVKLSLSLGLILYGIIARGRGLNAIWEAMLISEVVMLILLIPFASRHSKAIFQRSILSEMISYGLPLMLASVSSVLLVVTDRYMLNSMTGLEKTGIYSLGFRIANTLKLVLSTSFHLALAPLRMKKMDEPDNPRFYSKINTYTSFLFILALLGLSLFSLEILKVFTSSVTYWQAIGVIPIISYALFFGLMKDNVTIGLSIKKKTKTIGTLILIASILNILFNLVFIEIWDIYGAALATLLSQLFFMISVYITAQKAYPIPYELRKILIMLVISFLLLMGGFLLSDVAVWIRLPLKALILVSFPFILRLLKFYDKVELDTLLKIFRAWNSPAKIGESLKRLAGTK